MRRCPQCPETMKTATVGTASAERCGRCGGFWFEEGKLREFRAALDAGATLPVPDSSARELSKSARCHDDGKDLSFSPYAYGSGVQVGRCSICEGVWLPGPQVGKLISHRRTAGQDRDEVRATVCDLAEADRFRVHRHDAFFGDRSLLRSRRLFWLTVVPFRADAPNDVTPWATMALVVLQLLALTFSLETAARFVLVPAFLWRDQRWLTLVAYTFVHLNFFHFIGNALFLAVFGSALERTVGWPRFLLVYFVAALAGALGFGAWEGFASETVCLGASGAVAGVLGAYLVLLPRGKVHVFFFRDLWRLPAWAYIGGWLVLQVFGAMSGLSPHIAWSVHFGGFLAGAAIGGRWRASYGE